MLTGVDLHLFVPEYPAQRLLGTPSEAASWSSIKLESFFCSGSCSMRCGQQPEAIRDGWDRSPVKIWRLKDKFIYLWTKHLEKKISIIWSVLQEAVIKQKTRWLIHLNTFQCSLYNLLFEFHISFNVETKLIALWICNYQFKNSWVKESKRPTFYFWTGVSCSSCLFCVETILIALWRCNCQLYKIVRSKNQIGQRSIIRLELFFWLILRKI